MISWKGTIALEDEPTVDGRRILLGALTAAALPLPVFSALPGPPHRPMVGTITGLARDEQGRWQAEGTLDDPSPAGLGTGLAADLDDMIIDDDDLGAGGFTITQARIRAVTLTVAPAWPAATIQELSA